MESIKKLWYICIVEYYAAPRKNHEICIKVHEQGDIKLSKVSIKKSKQIHMISLMCGLTDTAKIERQSKVIADISI